MAQHALTVANVSLPKSEEMAAIEPRKIELKGSSPREVIAIAKRTIDDSD